MNQRKFGKTNRIFSEIGLGTWQLGTKCGEPFNEAKAIRILEVNYENGINLIDTANVYNGGNSELATGKFIAKQKKSFLSCQLLLTTSSQYLPEFSGVY